MGEIEGVGETGGVAGDRSIQFADGTGIVQQQVQQNGHESGEDVVGVETALKPSPLVGEYKLDDYEGESEQ